MRSWPTWWVAAALGAAALIACTAGSGAPTGSNAAASPIPTRTVPEPTIPAADPIADPSAFAQQGGVVAATSAPLAAPPTPITRPTPTPDPSIWRFEGVVVDQDGDPLPGVCVIIGPRGCRPGSIRTDGDGRYYVDMPQVTTVFYDFYFAKEGYQVVWYHANPQGPTVFNVVLKRS